MKKNLWLSNKAFTLMELLIVVVVLGVLASIGVPKFMRMLETRRTTEAENILSAVRTEQETRCVIGKKYLQEARRSEVLALRDADASSNYTYNLLPNGVEAQRGQDYTLRMWYKTGAFCCEGAGCNKLNKDYPSCGVAPATDECVEPIKPSDEPPQVLPPPPPPPGGCNCTGLDGTIYVEGDTETAACPANSKNSTHSRTCGSGCQWSQWSGCDCNEKPCEDGFRTEKCQCITCDAAKGLQLNASGTGCECSDAIVAQCAANHQNLFDMSSFSRQYSTADYAYCSCYGCTRTSEECAKEGKVLEYSSCSCVEEKKCELTQKDCARKGLVLYNAGSKYCECKPCDYWHEYAGKSKDGTKETCEASCKHTKQECAKKGLVLKNEGWKDCACVSCSEYSSFYEGKSTDGTVNTCDKASCKLTAADCKKQGKALYNGNSKDCRCESCDYYSQYKGTSLDGTFEGCEKNECKKTTQECAKQGLVLYGYRDDCKCISCSEYSSSYKGKSTDGTVYTCEENKCALSPSDCGKMGKVLKNGYSPDCQCVDCSSINPAYKGPSATGYESDCKGAKCELSTQDCAKKGQVLVDSYSKDCKCVPCNTDSRYKGTSKDGTYAGCEYAKCELSADICLARGGLVITREWSTNCECISCSAYSSSYEGPSTTGTPDGCKKKDNSDEDDSGEDDSCNLSPEKCAAQGGQVFYELGSICECRPCSAWKYLNYSGTTKTGLLKDCTECED